MTLPPKQQSAPLYSHSGKCQTLKKCTSSSSGDARLSQNQFSGNKCQLKHINPAMQHCFCTPPLRPFQLRDAVRHLRSRRSVCRKLSRYGCLKPNSRCTDFDVMSDSDVTSDFSVLSKTCTVCLRKSTSSDATLWLFSQSRDCAQQTFPS